jgi:phosphatidylserine/phosphatidylglycerophosphate/cardiolipin synthase-like enzyme
LVACTLMVAGLVVAARFTRSLDLTGRPPGSGPPTTPLMPYADGMDLRQAFESFPAAGNARVTPLVDNADAWRARWRLLAEARRSIDVKTFLLVEDVFGVACLGHLLARARDGVAVRVLVDGAGTRMSQSLAGRDVLDDVASFPGIALRRYRPLPTRLLDTLLRVQPEAAVASDHDKTILVDGELGLLGGRNIATEYFCDPADAGHSYRDVDVLIRSGSVADVLARAFLAQYASEHAVPAAVGDDADAADAASVATLDLAYRTMDAWLRDGELPATLREELHRRELTWGDDVLRHPELAASYDRAPPTPVEGEVRILDSTARFSGTDPITEGLARLVRSCRKEILITTPYLVLSDRAVGLLADASARGVRIVVLTNSPVSSDNALSQAFFLEQWPELLAAVPTMRLYVSGESDTLHAKCAALDGKLALVSTYNLEPASMTTNGEIMAAVWSPDLAGLIGRLVDAAVEGAPPVVYEYRIRRDARGEVVRQGGRPVIEFGPNDHCAPHDWWTLFAFRTIVRAADEYLGLGPMF